MKIPRSWTTAALLVLCHLNLTTSAEGELPDLDKEPWRICFAGYENSKVRLSIYTSGGLLIEPIMSQGEPFAYVNMPVVYGLEKTMPNGAKKILEVLPESLESDDEPSAKFKETTIRGKVEGGAVFEVIIGQNRGEVSIGGKITDPGTHEAASLRFHVSARVLNFYGRKKKELGNNSKAFEQLIKDDSLKFKWSNGKRKKLDFMEPRDMASEEINGQGVVEAAVEIGSLKKTFQFEATEKSAITFSNRKGAELNEGMLLNWSPDAKEDAKTEARFVISVK
ncbi:MAG: hypothetical protein QNK83_11815 [Akkermansiaceae bacterium]